MSEYKTAITDAAKQVHGDDCSQLTLSQFKSILARLYGDDDGKGGSYITGEKLTRIMTDVLGSDGCDAAMFTDDPQVQAKITWIYSISKQDGYLIAR